MTTRPDPVPFDAPAVERGIGFFETVLLHGRRAVLWEAHVGRLLATLAHFGLPAPARDVLEGQPAAVVEAAGVADALERALRISWIAVGQDLDRLESWRLDVTIRAIPPHTLRRRSGTRAITLPPELSRDTPGVKSTSYFASIMGIRLALKRNADEGLFVTPSGHYLEGTSTGLVAWGGGALLLSDGDGTALPSVTTAAFTRGRGRRVSLSEADLRAGCLLLGSLTKASPAAFLDGSPCDVPAQLAEQAREFNEALVSDPRLSKLL